MCIWEGEVNNMLALEQVTASYGGSRVLFGVDIKAKKGEITCLVGRNGVGKTTTVKSIMGLVNTPSGSITWTGKIFLKCPLTQGQKQESAMCPREERYFLSLQSGRIFFWVWRPIKKSVKYRNIFLKYSPF